MFDTHNTYKLYYTIRSLDEPTPPVPSRPDLLTAGHSVLQSRASAMHHGKQNVLCISVIYIYIYMYNMYVCIRIYKHM